MHAAHFVDLFADYGSATYATPTIGLGVTEVDLETHTLRVGLSYRFSQ